MNHPAINAQVRSSAVCRRPGDVVVFSFMLASGVA